MMQAFRTENNYRNASRLSAAELRAAMASREILQSTALAFDTQRQLRFELGGCRAVMPFGQCADGADTGSVRDIAVLTRVGRPTCFVIEGISFEIEESDIGSKLIFAGMRFMLAGFMVHQKYK